MAVEQRPPYVFMTAEGQMQGSDIELLRAQSLFTKSWTIPDPSARVLLTMERPDDIAFVSLEIRHKRHGRRLGPGQLAACAWGLGSRHGAGDVHRAGSTWIAIQCLQVLNLPLITR